MKQTFFMFTQPFSCLHNSSDPIDKPDRKRVAQVMLKINVRLPQCFLCLFGIMIEINKLLKTHVLCDIVPKAHPNVHLRN